MTTTLATSAGTLTVLTADVREPLEGAWTARVEVDSEDPVTGSVTLDIDGVTFVGTARRGAVEHGRYVAQLVGGAGGLGTELTAQAYDSVSLATVLADIMTATGEALSDDIGAALLAAQVARWSRPTGPAGLSLAQVAKESAGDHWRVLRDGTVWIGAEAWGAVSADYDYIEIGRDPSQGTVTLAPEDGAPLIRPGQTWTDKAGASRNVAAVTTQVRPGSIRQVLSLQDEDGASVADRRFGPLRRAVEAFVGRRIDYTQMYPCTVVGQSGDALDLTPDDPRIAGDGFKNVKLTVGIPGVSVTVAAGGRVNLYFLNGDPKEPRAALWPDGSSATSVTIDATALTLGDGSEAMLKGSTHLTDLLTLVTALSTYASAGTNPGKAALVSACTAFATASAAHLSTKISGE